MGPFLAVDGLACSDASDNKGAHARRAFNCLHLLDMAISYRVKLKPCQYHKQRS
jgi:hypothetical protein